MSITPEVLKHLMQEIEREDPIDFADLPFKDGELRDIVSMHMCDVAAKMDDFSDHERYIMMLAIAAKLSLENLVLHVQLERDQHVPLNREVDQLLAKLRKPA